MTGTPVAVIGLGAMGAGMAHRLLATGHPVIAHNRTLAKARPLEIEGACVTATAAAAASQAPQVVVSLSDEAAVESVLFGQVVPALRPGTLVLNTSSVSSRYARRAAARLAAAGARPVEAAVVGNPGMARSGQLRIFTAGDPADAGAAAGLLASLGQAATHLGPPGTAAAAKLAFNLLLGAQVAALAEAVALGTQAGVDRALMIDSIARSGFSSPVLAFRAEFMRTRVYEPAAFKSRLMAKDLRYALGDAGHGGCRLPVASAVADSFAAAVASGAGDLDAAALAEQFPARPPQPAHEPAPTPEIGAVR